MRRMIRWILALAFVFDWQSFGDTRQRSGLSLDAAYTEALKHSAAVQLSKARVAFERARVMEARAAFLPTLQLKGNAGTFNDRQVEAGATAVPANPTLRKDFSVSFLAKQNLFASFSSTETFRAANAQLAATEADLILEQAKLKRELIEEYFAIQKIRQERSAELDLAKIRAKQEKEITLRIRQGRAAKLDLTLLKLEEAEQDSRLANLEQQERQATLLLNRRLNREPYQDIQLSDPLETAFDVITREELPDFKTSLALAVKNNPQLISEQQRMDADQASLRAETAEYGPSVDLVFEAGSRAAELSQVSERDQFGYGVNLELSIPLFSGFGGFAKHAQLTSKQLERAAKQRDLLESILRDLGAAYADLSAAEKSIVAERRAVTLADKAIEQSLQLYRSGRLELQGVLENNRAKLNAQLRLYQAMHRQVLASAEINRVIGR